MAKWPRIPKDAVDWVRSVFAEANRQSTQRLINLPNIRETSLDDGLVEAITVNSAPRLLASGAGVELHVHNIGGLRRIGQWETADIAVLVFVYRGSNLVVQKIGLLQSKRLYPSNGDVDDNDPVGFRYGLNGMFHRDGKSPLSKLRRKFEFNDASVYGQIKAGTEQLDTIDDFNKRFGEAIYYLLYNPPDLPSTVHYPLTEARRVFAPPLGCRVVRARDVHRIVRGMQAGQSPTVGQLQTSPKVANWQLEAWVADELLKCRVGQQFDESKDEMIGQMIERRSGPIGAAIAVDIALPDPA